MFAQDKTVNIGIVAEYNPFHNGHAWQIARARDEYAKACIIAVMSGNFVQRGQPAILDKWQRAQVAVDSGVDLVLELPFSFACRSAEHFARGSIGILNALGIVDRLVFGAECPDIRELQTIAAHSLQPHFVGKLKEYMKSGLSYPQALQSVLSTDNIRTATIDSPNNILAVEYLKQLMLINSSIQPQMIVRHAAGYKDTTITGPIASATAIRKQLSVDVYTATQALPQSAANTIELAQISGQLVFEDDEHLSLLCIYRLRSLTPEYLRTHTDVSEGLEYSILKNAALHNNLTDLLASLVNKRYTHSRISRIIMQALVGMYKAEHPTYIRPLAFSRRGRVALGQIKSHATLPLIAKLGRNLVNLPIALQQCPILQTEINSGNIYQLLLANVSGVHNLDFFKSPYFKN